MENLPIETNIALIFYHNIEFNKLFSFHPGLLNLNWKVMMQLGWTLKQQKVYPEFSSELW